MDDLISRQNLIMDLTVTAEETAQMKAGDLKKVINVINKQPSAQRWIPVKWKPLNDLEREEWEDQLGYKLSDEEVKFGEADFKLPDDGDDIWVCTKSGIVDGDIFYNDNGMITLEYADITDIVAWMPRKEPEPYKGENAND